MYTPKRILIIRFRQIGDAILTSALCTTLKNTFPNAQIDIVLNENISPLFIGHPSIDNIITFDAQQRSSLIKYVKRIWKVMHENKYDVIIDMRSTIKTLLFSLFSLHSSFRIGRKKWYSRFLLNYTIDTYNSKISLDMVQRNLLLASPLEKIRPIEYTNEFRLYLSELEKNEYREYLINNGINFNNPIILVGLTTKLDYKEWNIEYMKEVIKWIIKEYPDYQLIFNYAPGGEEEEARRVFMELDSPSNIKIDIKAKSLRKLMALCANSSFYFGNEGGARHMAQALGVKSFSIFSPNIDKSVWLPKSKVYSSGISSKDICPGKNKEISYKEYYDLITPEIIKEKLKAEFESL